MKLFFRKSFLFIFLVSLLGFSFCLSFGFSETLEAKNSSTQLVNILAETQPDIAEARYYKITENQKLQLHIFYPEGYKTNRQKPYPVALSFHGGAWTQGPIEWGYSDAQYFASLGFVGIAVEYRLAGSISVLEQMKDANSSVRWTRKFAEDFNFDSEKILAVGHSSGGHLALSTAMFPRYKENSEDSSISSVPNLVWALAPPVSLAKDYYFRDLLKGKERGKNCSPLDNIRPGLVPIHIIHGTKDELLPVSATRKFVEKMKKAGNPVSFREYESGDHVFFYDNGAGTQFCRERIKEITIESGWLE